MKFHKNKSDYYIFHIHNLWWGKIPIEDVSEEDLRNMSLKSFVNNFYCTINQERKWITFSSDALEGELLPTDFFDGEQTLIPIYESRSGRASVGRMGNFWWSHFKKKEFSSDELNGITIDKAFEQFGYTFKGKWYFFTKLHNKSLLHATLEIRKPKQVVKPKKIASAKKVSKPKKQRLKNGFYIKPL